MRHPGHIPAHIPTTPEITGDLCDYAVNYHKVNAREDYPLHMVFKRTRPLPGDTEHLGHIEARLKECLKGTVVRGWYDVSGFRADADLVIWTLANNPEALQVAYRRVGALGTCHGRQTLLKPVWCAVSRHLPTGFNESHLPACQGGFALHKYMMIYPLVRSQDWYYLPAARHSTVLKEHGLSGTDYNGVAISTLAAFVLGDWEWTVTLEVDKMNRVMGVLHKQRKVEARLFIRVDTPFYTRV